MTKIINFPTDRRAPLAPIEDRICSIPIIDQALFFLTHAGQGKGIRLTEKGALGRNFVQAFWDQKIKGPHEPFRPTREFECPEASRIHTLLTESKYVRKFKGAITLTPKGRRLQKTGPDAELYYELLMVCIFCWNWGFEDRYPEFEFIQGSAKDLVQHLWKWPSQSLSAAEFFDSVFEQFDNCGEAAGASEVGANSPDLDLHDWAVRCFHTRFFRRFCLPFGILQEKESESTFRWDPKDIFAKTEFFISDFPRIINR